MKHSFFLISFFYLSVSTSPATNTALLLNNNGQDLNVVLNNVCEYYAQIILCSGNDSLGIHPSMGSGNCPFDPHYEHLDSFLNLNDVRFLQFGQDGFAPWNERHLFLGNSSIIMSYSITYGNYYCDTLFIVPRDTLAKDSVVDMKVWDGPILIRNSVSTPNFEVYDSILALNYSIQLNTTPKFLSLSGHYAGVIGINQNLETTLHIVDLLSQQILEDTVLGNTAENPYAFRFKYLSVLLLASVPGDSAVVITKYNYQNQSSLIDTVYTGGGINTGEWIDVQFHFQPETDTTGTGNERKIFKYDAQSMSLSGIYDIDMRLSSIQLPVDGAVPSYVYVNLISDSAMNSVFVYDYFNYWLFDSFSTPENPVCFLHDYRCPVNVSEYDDSRIEWKVYPNPSLNDFKLSASGLICGREYKMDIVNEQGKVVYESTVHAKMTATLPTARFPSGMYFVRIHTLKGLVTQQIIKQ